MMKSQIFTLIPKKQALKLLLLVSLQQGLNALGTWSLAEAAWSVSEVNSMRFLALTALSLFLFVAPQTLTPALKKIEFETYWQSYGHFLKARLFVHQGKSGLWQNHHQKESFQSSIGTDTEGSLSAVLFSLLDIYTFALTVILNITALSVVVDSLFPWAFVLSAALSLASFRFFAKYIEVQTEREQNEKIGFFAYLLKSWDNVLINNPGVNKRYANRLFEQHRATQLQIGRSQQIVELATLGSSLLSSLPLFGLILYLAQRDAGQIGALSALLATLPRQMMVLTNLRFFFEQANALLAFHSRFKKSWKSSTLEPNDLKKRVHTELIHCNRSPVRSIDDILAQMQSQSSGRYLIQGVNGSGKSSLLLYLNENLVGSFYLPTHPQLEIGEDANRESSGERVVKHLEYALRSGSRYLLLDEWDANLDEYHQARIHERLYEISESCVVIEVRHSRS